MNLKFFDVVSASLIAIIEGDTTAHEVRQRARCHNCGVKGNNTYQIVYTGNSDIAMDGTGVGSAKEGLKDSIERTATTD